MRDYYSIPRRRYACTLSIAEGDNAALATMRDTIQRELFPEPTPVRARSADCEYRNFCADVF